MTGTAKELAAELRRVYDLSVTRIPTHRPTRRRRLADRVLADSEERWIAVAERAAAIAAEGRPVLVGTRSVAASEILSGLLTQHSSAHTVLNARQDEVEAEAVGHAGEAGCITVATNMAGRGTDIKLAPGVDERGGLHVILTEFHESARIDRQLFGRSARQGNSGTVEAIVSLDDELFARYAPMATRLGRRVWLGENRVAALLFRWLVRYAQFRAERYNRGIRLDTLRRDRKWLEALGFVGAERK
jgi:preprotein translocase subunit SecA